MLLDVHFCASSAGGTGTDMMALQLIPFDFF